MKCTRFIWLVLIIMVVMLFGANEVAAASKWQIKFGHDHKVTSPHHAAAMFMKNKIEQGSGGKIKVTIYPASVLGTGTQMVEMLQAGAIQMLAVPTSNVQVIDPPLRILDLPFLFRDKKSLYRHLKGDFGQALFDPLLKKNIVGLAYWESGFKELTCKYPIYQPTDLKGLKFRIMPSPIIREQFKALGAAPVPIDFHELYNALQQGVVDGEENPLVGIATMKLYEVQNYVTMTNHAWLGYAVMVNKHFLESLPGKFQRLICDVAKESTDYEIKLLNEENRKYLETIEKSGTKIIELSPQQRRAFQAAVKPVYRWFVKNVKDGNKYLHMIQK